MFPVMPCVLLFSNLDFLNSNWHDYASEKLNKLYSKHDSLSSGVN